jgi:DNA-binding transcriptional LysR family regulator
MLRTTLRRLEVFVAAVEAGGFRACSDRLEISQAAVSHHMKQLEDELGYELFVRRRGATAGVTRQGAAAYHQAKELLDEACRLELAAGDVRRTPLRLNVHADAILDAIVAQRVTEHLTGSTALEVSLRQSYFEEMVEAYNTGRADIVYFYAHGPVAELESSLCWYEPVCICAREDHPLHRLGVVDPSVVTQYPFVAPPKASHFRRSVDRMFRHAGLGGYPIAFEVDHMRMAREAVVKGLAISAVITRYLDEDLSRYGVRKVPVRGLSLALQVRRAMGRELALNDSVARLTEYVDRAESDAPAAAPEARPARVAWS